MVGVEHGGLGVDANRTHSKVSNKMAKNYFSLASCLLHLQSFFPSRVIKKVPYTVTEHIVPSPALKAPSFVNVYPVERGLTRFFLGFFEELMKWCGQRSLFIGIKVVLV